MSQRCSKYFLTIYSLAFFSCAFFTSWQTINYKSCHLQATALRSGHNTTSEDVLTERHIRYNKRELKKKTKTKKLASKHRFFSAHYSCCLTPQCSPKQLQTACTCTTTFQRHFSKKASQAKCAYPEVFHIWCHRWIEWPDTV